MNKHRMQKILIIVFLIMFVSACSVPTPASPTKQAPVISESIADIVAKYQEEIRQKMEQENIPGVAIAVVDDQSILWEQGFGYTNWDKQTPVTPSTVFSIQSMSKSFTATATMFAAQDGLVDLDAPIATYLPDFHVHSIFEEHPEQKITLRMLLSHTAGFPHEAPYGSNYDHPAYSFEKHIDSISDTWLKFPVGTRYYYSNLGVDLAGYILQVRSGMPFIQYVQEKVLDPLGMKDSTLGISRLRADPMRAIGHVMGSTFPPAVDFLIIPSGGVWTSAEDMARYLQFHINKGALNGTRLLSENLAETMYTSPNMPAQKAYQDSSYALGITVNTRNGARHFQHGGGSWGFNSSMVWYPELKLGAVVLCNAELSDDLVVRWNEGILDSIIASSSEVYAQRARSAVQAEPAYLPDKTGNILSDYALHNLIANKALPEDAASEQQRSALAGTYFYAELRDMLEISGDNGELAYSYMGYTNPLTEVERGLYFSPYGDAMDFRGRIPTFSNVRLVKVNAPTWFLRIAFYVLCGLLFLSALFYLPVRALIRRIRRKSRLIAQSHGLVWAGILAALASLFSLLCLAFIAVIPDLIYIPWPRPYVDLLWWQFALLSLPFAGLGLALVIALLVGLAMRTHASGRALSSYYLLVALALLAFNLILLI